jgi:hypothetical protein
MLLALGVAVLVPTNVRSASGMAAMQYYVGKWSCLTGSVGGTSNKPLEKSIETYVIESGVMRETYVTPVQSGVPKPYVLTLLTAYDAKNDRYVAAALDSSGGLTTGTITLNGNVEQWIIRETSSGKLGRGTVVRTDSNHFTFTSYPTLTATKPDFKEVCERS